MRNMLLLVASLFILNQGITQEYWGQLEGAVGYDGEPFAFDIYTFDTDEEAEAVVAWILEHTGVSGRRFSIRAANVPNASAMTRDGNRVILYNRQWLREARQGGAVNWVSVGVIAHEIGHHMEAHNLLGGGSRPTLELEADAYAGYVMAQMGASLAQAQMSIQQLIHNERGTSTHPPKSARLQAVAQGWYQACDRIGCEASSAPIVPTPPQPQNETHRFSSNPTGATILVNGQAYGETPIELRFPLGSYAVTWRLTGYQEVEQSLLVDGSRADQGVISQHQELARVALGTTPITRNRDWTPVEQDFNGTTMVLVPAGSFEMGSNDGGSNERPRTRQTFEEPFWLDKTEVSRGAYEACVRAGSCTAPSRGANVWSDQAQQPINYVTWHQAQAYCIWRESRLPTEREWEYAARGPDGLVYPWGNEFQGEWANHADSNSSLPWKSHHDDGYEATSAVGSYIVGASWVGALDMAGNVWEWTQTLYKGYPYSTTDGREIDNYERNMSESVVLRGGSFGSSSGGLRAAFRFSWSPDDGDDGFGFRCARSF